MKKEVNNTKIGRYLGIARFLLAMKKKLKEQCTGSTKWNLDNYIINKKKRTNTREVLHERYYFSLFTAGIGSRLRFSHFF